MPVSEENLKQYQNANLRGGIEGFLASGVLTGAATLYLRRSSPVYRALPTSLKSAAVLIPMLAATVIQAERRGLEYERSTWANEKGTAVLENTQHALERHWDTLSRKEKMLEWVDNHEYGVILGAWAASLGISGAIISQNKYQTFSQKVVQARMWAQGLTVALLIGAGMFHTYRARQGAFPSYKDHSWEDIIRAQEQEKLKIKA